MKANALGGRPAQSPRGSNRDTKSRAFFYDQQKHHPDRVVPTAFIELLCIVAQTIDC
jgi:hypothetical protein